jgi:SSS family solute:Na+ symporter
MATQASAITFLSTPGQAYEDGLRFVQFYFGLPLAMVVLSAVVVPRYYQLRVVTAYEFLEKRFDLKTRQLAAFLFLVQRGLSAGITLYAPAIILTTVLGWSLNLTILATGGLVILYTVSGGARAVSQTQKVQILAMMDGLALIFVWLLRALPPRVSFSDALHIAGAMGKMNAVDFSFDLDSRYTFWSGLAGGFFLAMAYFGTDQSQVQRYLSGRSVTHSRLGLLFNGLFKLPMQFFILLVGIIVLVLHQFERPPLFFNQVDCGRVHQTAHAPEALRLETAHAETFKRKRQAVLELEAALATENAPREEGARVALRDAAGAAHVLRREAAALVGAALPGAETRDTDYIFIGFVLDHLPRRLLGLLLAVILCAAMSSSSAELSALSATTVVDFYRRSLRRGASDRHYLAAARAFTVMWGLWRWRLRANQASTSLLFGMPPSITAAQASGPRLPGAPSHRSAAQITSKLVLERRPVEFGADPREHGVEAEAYAEKEHELPWQAHLHQLAFELDRLPHGHRSVRRNGAPTGREQRCEEAAQQPTRDVEVGGRPGHPDSAEGRLDPVLVVGSHGAGQANEPGDRLAVELPHATVVQYRDIALGGEDQISWMWVGIEQAMAVQRAHVELVEGARRPFARPGGWL